MHKRRLILALLLAAGQSAHASTSQLLSLSLEELTSLEINIASTTPKTLKDSPAVVSVFTRDMIESLGARQLDDVLEFVPGLHVGRSPDNRLQSLYTIRGMHTYFNPHVQLMVDGVPLRWAQFASIPTHLKLSTDLVDQVEVIRGPASALYGSDAFSGVINVSSARLEEGMRGGYRAGSFDSHDYWLLAGNSIGDWHVQLNASQQSSEGDRDRIIESDLQSDLDLAFGTSASLAPLHLQTNYQSENVQLKIERDKTQVNVWHWQSLNAGNGPGAAQALDPVGSDDSYVSFLNLSQGFGNEGFSHHIKATYYRAANKVNFVIFPEGTTLAIGADGNVNFAQPVGFTQFPEGLIGRPEGIEKTYRISWDGNLTLENHILSAELGYEKISSDVRERKNFGPGVLDGTQLVAPLGLTDVTGTDYIFSENTMHNNHHMLIQDEWQASDKINVILGARYDHYSDVGSDINPRAALIWKLNEKASFKLLHGTAFRAPSIAEQYYKNNPINLGNRDIQPESMTTTEAVLHYNFNDRVTSELNLFRYSAKDLILYQSQGSTAMAQNTGEQTGQGFEFQVNWQAHANFLLHANIAYQNSEKGSDENVADAPGRQFSSWADWRVNDAVALSLSYHLIADRKRAEGDPQSPISDYSNINFSARYRPTSNLGFHFSAKNLGDSEQLEPSSPSLQQDYPLEGRSLWLGLELNL